MSIFNATDNTFFSTISAAMDASSSGDVLMIPAGLYVEEFPLITHSLTLQGVGGMAHLQTPNPQPANDRAVLFVKGFQGADLTVRNLEISGAARPIWTNGAGILFESGNGKLTVVDSWLHHNENGILAGGGANATVEIIRSEFSFNGNPTYAGAVSAAHNLYVNDVVSLTVTDSLFHSVRTHHELKSRAHATTILNSRFVDGPDSQASYSIDLPNGGIARIEGNQIVKGPQAVNRHIIHFGGEAVPTWPGSRIDIVGNIIINQREAGATALFNQSRDAGGAANPAAMTGNTIYNVPVLHQTVYGPYDLTLAGNLMLTGAAPSVSLAPPWQSNTAATPEPASVVLLGAAMAAGLLLRRRRGTARA